MNFIIKFILKLIKSDTPESIGSKGEHLTAQVLNKLDMHKRIFLNVYVPIDGKTTEIDLILVTLKGIYVIESKNYSGWIVGSPMDRYWTQTLGKKKYQFYNPILQNIIHINALKKQFDSYSNLRYTSYVVFSERCTLKNIKYDHDLVFILNRNFLFNHIKNHLQYRTDILTIDEFNSICEKLESYCNFS